MYYVSYTSLDLFSNLEKTIDLFAESMHLTDKATIWIGLLAHPNWKSFIATEEGQSKVTQTMQQCQGMLADLGSVASVHQTYKCPSMYVFWELEIASSNWRDVYVGSHLGVLACSRPFPDGSWVFSSFDPELAQRMGTWTVMEAYDYEVNERCKMIHRGHSPAREPFSTALLWTLARSDEKQGKTSPTQLSEEPLKAAEELCFDRFNAQLHRWAAGPLLHLCAARGEARDKRKICEVLSTPGLSINSSRLRGPSAESPLHVSAACGHIE
eukprot:1628264-Amphidinium_carterae.1